MRGSSMKKRGDKKKIRRLMEKISTTNCDNGHTNTRRRATKILLSAFALGAIITILCANQNYLKFVSKDFAENYRAQYQQIVHGRWDYCQATIDSKQLRKSLEKNFQILNQENALNEFENALMNQSQFLSIAVVGPSGVGKSLFAQALRKTFVWQENTQACSWPVVVNDEDKYIAISKMISNLSECGRNLIIIDDLSVKNKNDINELNQKFQQATTENIKLILIYIINLPSFVARPNRNFNNFSFIEAQDLPKIKIINFREFFTSDIKDCIKREAKLENLTLSHNSVENIVNLIDAQRSGCKNVYSKVLLYGK